MLEGLTSKAMNYLCGTIPIISGKRGGLEALALVGELGAWSVGVSRDKAKICKRLVLAAFKTIQIVACLGSLPLFASTTRYAPV
ncbi:MAG: hypothetical protein ACRDFB_00905, partial [Rhabdochlamydiaceae bacterium]